VVVASLPGRENTHDAPTRLEERSKFASWVRSSWPTPAVDRVRGAPASGIVLTLLELHANQVVRPAGAVGRGRPAGSGQRAPGGRLAATPALADGTATDAAEQLALALSLWRRPAPADFRYETVAQAEVARLDELRLIGEQPLRALRLTSPVCRPRRVLTPGRRMIAAT
jgi:hypothetical protein